MTAKKQLWISNIGIRVTNMKRSLKFYKKIFDLEELVRGGYSHTKYVLLRDKRSGQRLELNWYSKNSPYWAPYVLGEGLDHIEVRVKSVSEMVKRLKRLRIPLATKKVWANKAAIRKFPTGSIERRLFGKDIWSFNDGPNVVFIQDPDGNFIDFYDSPREKWSEGPIPDHY